MYLIFCRNTNTCKDKWSMEHVDLAILHCCMMPMEPTHLQHDRFMKQESLSVQCHIQKHKLKWPGSHLKKLALIHIIVKTSDTGHIWNKKAQPKTQFVAVCVGVASALHTVLLISNNILAASGC